jgi:hypothetical protein
MKGMYSSEGYSAQAEAKPFLPNLTLQHGSWQDPSLYPAGITPTWAICMGVRSRLLGMSSIGEGLRERPLFWAQWHWLINLSQICDKTQSIIREILFVKVGGRTAATMSLWHQCKGDDCPHILSGCWSSFHRSATLLNNPRVEDQTTEVPNTQDWDNNTYN